MPVQQILLAVGGAPVTKVQDVFSVDLWTGDGSSTDIDNDIKLSGEGGMVWIKNRDRQTPNPNVYTYNHLIFDTVRGNTKYIIPSITFNIDPSEQTSSSMITSFNSDGYSVGSDNSVNQNGDDIVGWTFRKHPKFFDIATATVASDASVGTTITHSLESDLGMAVIKSRTNPASQGYNWLVWHKQSTATANQYFTFNEDNGRQQQNNTMTYDSSSKTFTFGYPAADMGDRMRPGTGSNSDLVGYFFAHNDGDGEFGPDGDQDIIKTGTYTGNGSPTGTVVTVGFEPQFVIIKHLNPSTYNGWYMFDTTRGVQTGSTDAVLRVNWNNAESSSNLIKFTSTGFQLEAQGAEVNQNGHTYIYIAIRKDDA